VCSTLLVGHLCRVPSKIHSELIITYDKLAPKVIDISGTDPSRLNFTVFDTNGNGHGFK
jgi:hypothetical protein